MDRLGERYGVPPGWKHVEEPSTDLIEEASSAIRHVCFGMLATLADEVSHRVAIYRATDDPTLATQGTSWEQDFQDAKQSLPGMPDTDPTLARYVLGSELSRRLYGAEVCISEELFRFMSQQPRLPAWTQRNPNGGLFYVAKAWALAEALGIDLSPIVSSSLPEVP